MKKILIALGGVVALSVAGCSWLAWNTGKAMPTRMDAMLAHANQQLQVALGHEAEARLELLSSTFHTFSADARYRVTYEAVGEDPVQLEFVDRIEYGPLPWSRVKRMELVPVRAASNFSLVKTEGSANWFAVSKGEVPLRGAIRVGYDETINTRIEIAPFEIPQRNFLLSATGGSLLLSSAKDDRDVVFSGAMGHLKLQERRESVARLAFDLDGITMSARLGLGGHGLRTGWLKMNFKEASLALGDIALTFGNVARHDTYQFADDGYSMRQILSSADIRLADWSYGNSRLAWRAEGVDPAALRKYLDWRSGAEWDLIKSVVVEETTGAANENSELFNEAEAKAAIRSLLKSRPKVFLEELSFKNTEGESRADIAVQLRRPDAENLSFAELHAQMLESAHVNLKLSKSTVDTWEKPFFLKSLIRDFSSGEARRKSWWERVSVEAKWNPVMVVTDDSILMDLRLITPDDLEVNGKKMTKDEFSELIRRGARRRALLELP